MDSKKNIWATQDMRFSQMCSESFSLLAYEIKLVLPCRWWQQAPLKLSCLCTKLHGIIPENWNLQLSKWFAVCCESLFRRPPWLHISLILCLQNEHGSHGATFVLSLHCGSMWFDVQFFWHVLFFCWSGEYCTFQHIAIRQHCR